MKASNNLISVIITTYNRYETLKCAIQKVLEQTYTPIEIIVSDDCSTDDTYKIQNDFPTIKYVKTDSNLGYTQNCKHALSFALGDFVIFATDDDVFKENSFFEKAIKRFEESDDIDLVFSRVEICYQNNKIINKYPFKDEYTALEFFHNLEELRLNFDDYYVFSSIIFKREKLESIHPFKSVFDNSATIDSSIIFRYTAVCRKIAFLNLVGYQWHRPFEESLSNSHRSDLVKQAQFNLAFPFDVDKFITNNDDVNDELKQQIKKMMNQRVEYSFQAILSEKERLNNQVNFENLFKQIDLNHTLYIYGRGWTGLELKNFLNENHFSNYVFIDDYKVDFEDTITFEKFSAIKEFKQVVITSYKYKDVYNIYRKLNTLENIVIYDLMGTKD